MVEILEIGQGQQLLLAANRGKTALQQITNPNKAETIMVCKEDLEAAAKLRDAGNEVYKARVAELEEENAKLTQLVQFYKEQEASWKKKCAALADSLEAFKRGKQIVRSPQTGFFPNPPQPGKLPPAQALGGFKLIPGE